MRPRTHPLSDPFAYPDEFKSWLPDWLRLQGFRDLGFPVGCSMTYRGTVVPDGWYREDGSTVPVSTNQRLYGVIGTTYNTGGEPAGTFRLPDTSSTEFTIIKA